VVGAEYPFPGGQDPLEQHDRLGDAARIPVGGGKVVLCRQGGGVVGAEYPFPGGQDPLMQQDRVDHLAQLQRMTGEGATVTQAARILKISSSTAYAALG
jgi:hypothetical protein